MLIDKAFRIGRVQYGPGSALGPRDTIGYEFVRILKGNVEWTYDKEVHQLGPGSFLLSQPGHIEHYRWDQDDLTQHDYIHFYADHLPDDFPAPNEWALCQRLPAQNILHAQFQYIIDLYRSNHPQAMQLIMHTLEQILRAWAYDLHQFEDRGFRDYTGPVQQVLDMVHARWRQQEFRPPAMELIVQASGVSRSSIIRAFKKECGDSPSKFFEQQCLLFGRLLLLETNRSIEAISDELGYPNPFHFSKNFKNAFGLSPRAYRQKPPPEEGPYRFRHIFELLSATQSI